MRSARPSSGEEGEERMGTVTEGLKVDAREPWKVSDGSAVLWGGETRLVPST